MKTVLQYTPEVSQVVKEVGRLNRRLRREPDLEHLSLDERQDLRRQLAEKGEEVTLGELDDIIKLASKIRSLEF